MPIQLQIQPTKCHKILQFLPPIQLSLKISNRRGFDHDLTQRFFAIRLSHPTYLNISKSLQISSQVEQKKASNFLVYPTCRSNKYIQPESPTWISQPSNGQTRHFLDLRSLAFDGRHGRWTSFQQAMKRRFRCQIWGFPWMATPNSWMLQHGTAPKMDDNWG